MGFKGFGGPFSYGIAGKKFLGGFEGLKDSLFGTAGSIDALPTMSGEQQDLFSQLLGGLSGPLGQGMGNLSDLLGGGSESFQAPAMRNFQENIIPQIGERFSGLGEGAQGSSAFGQALGGAGAGLAENLAMQGENMKQTGFSQLMQMLGMGVQTPTHQYQQMPGTEGMFSSIMKGLGAGAGQMAGTGGSALLMKALGFGG